MSPSGSDPAGTTRFVALLADELAPNHGAGANLNPSGATTAVMMGLNKVLTPVSSGKVLVIVSGEVTNNTSGDGCKYGIRYGTGTPPVNGAAVTGTQIGTTVTAQATGSVLNAPFSHHGVAVGLVPGTAYWFDISLQAVGGGGGTAAAKGVNITLVEL